VPSLLRSHSLPFKPSANSIFLRQFLLSHSDLNWGVRYTSGDLISDNRFCDQTFQFSWRNTSVILHEFLYSRHWTNKGPNFSVEINVCEQTIESRVSLLIISSQYESNLFSGWMNNFVSDSLEFVITIFDEGNGRLFFDTVWIINIGPNTFNIVGIVDILNDIHLSVGCIACSKMIVSLSLPNSQCSISHSDIVIFLMNSQPGNEIPRLVLTRQ